MRQVVVDGIPYFPATAHRYGIAVTTLDRHDILAETLTAIEKFAAPGTPVVVVDDGSAEPVVAPEWVTIVRHAEPQGIPAAKNAGIAALMDAGVEHLFLFDDDTRPADQDIWDAYIGAPEPHYQYCWTHFASGTKRAVPKMDVLYQDSDVIAYGWSMGCMLYATADVVRAVGGMWPGFGRGYEEHAEWSQRINNAGLTSFVHQDIPGSARLIYASDEHGSVTRSVDWKDRTALIARNERLRLERANSVEYVEYRAVRDVVVTSYLVGQPDPQRSKPYPADLKAVAPLAGSVRDLVLLTNIEAPDTTMLTPGASLEVVPVDAPLVAYHQRWLSEFRWLRDHPEVRYAWLVDATDVTMLNDPFAAMQPGTLYCGWEPRTVGCQWIRDNSPERISFVDAMQHEMLLNCGVVGGDRASLMWLCQRMIHLWVPDGPLHEMVNFNIAVREHGRFVTGPQITPPFKQGIGADDPAWFGHKNLKGPQ